MAQNEERDDARDVQAMRCAEEEARQELAEFDETRPIVDDEREEDMIDVEMRQLTEQVCFAGNDGWVFFKRALIDEKQFPMCAKSFVLSRKKFSKFC